MPIHSPHERPGKPLIGFNHMSLEAFREGDEASMLVGRNFQWSRTIDAALER